MERGISDKERNDLGIYGASCNRVKYLTRVAKPNNLVQKNNHVSFFPVSQRRCVERLHHADRR